jgi:AraC-like DNA-binding protein
MGQREKTNQKEVETKMATYEEALKKCVEHYMEPIGLEMMAKELYLNKHYISYIFKERMNVNCKDFVNRLRVEHACNMLTKDTPITECAYASGFSSVRTFNRAFLNVLCAKNRKLYE